MKYALIALLSVLPACAQLLEIQDKSATQTAKGIEQYCKNTDAEFRAKFQAAINEKAAPNAIDVTCK